jgi:hypothetical protein
MAVAMIYPIAEHGCDRKSEKGSSFGAKLEGFSAARLSKARTVLAHAPDLARGVLTGNPSLDVAYEKAIELKKEAETDDQKMKRLRADAPDLVDASDHGGSQQSHEKGRVTLGQRHQRIDQTILALVLVDLLEPIDLCPVGISQL